VSAVGCHAKQRLGMLLLSSYKFDQNAKVICYSRYFTNSDKCEVRFELLKVVSVHYVVSWLWHFVVL